LRSDFDYPPAFSSADQASLRGQRRAARLTFSQLALLVIAAVGGGVNVKVRDGSLNLGGVVAVLGFAGALVTALVLQARHPEEQWYQGRAGAESIKTLAWRYAVGGDPFLLDHPDADDLLLSRIGEVMKRLRDLEWLAIDGQSQVSSRMSALRRSNLDARKAAYSSERVDDQIGWYNRNSRVNAVRAGQLAWLGNGAAFVGLALGLARATALLDVDLLGVMAALATAVSAWSQLRQHRTLAVSYALAAQELALVKARLPTVEDEGDWSRFVSDAEDAISREHTMWLARRSQVAET
jgi:hypothetical protein